ncbi:hypothetical protein, partial [Stenotrophomonas sp. NPDC077659]|uniref:hypothetical protein n=1 Tax=Stenotrophomonas sp. NPDC077659 TaxID=3390694 RepID=UPI003D01083A
ATAMAASEQVLMPRFDGYVKAFEASDPQTGHITEFVPKGQTVEAWTDMVTVNIAPNSAWVSPRDFLGSMEAGWRGACPDAEVNWLREGVELGRQMAVLMLSCPLNPGTGKPETAWVKGIQGEQGFYTVQKAFRTEVKEADVVTWVKWLSGVALCGGDEGPACPGEPR